LVEATADTGVVLVYENHGKLGAWKYTDFSQPPEVFLEIVERTADVGLSVNFDTGNAAAFADDPVALLEQVVDRVETVHAADTAVRGALHHVLLGTGITPYKALFATLKEHGMVEDALFFYGKMRKRLGGGTKRRLQTAWHPRWIGGMSTVEVCWWNLPSGACRHI